MPLHEPSCIGASGSGSIWRDSGFWESSCFLHASGAPIRHGAVRLKCRRPDCQAHVSGLFHLTSHSVGLQMASTMDQFERQFENLDVQSEFVENAMGNQATLSTPEEDVNLLLQQARDITAC